MTPLFWTKAPAFTVVVVEYVEDMLPLVVFDDVDDCRGVQRSYVKRDRRRGFFTPVQQRLSNVFTQ